MDITILNEVKPKTKTPIKFVRYIMNSCDSFDNSILPQDQPCNMDSIMCFKKEGNYTLDLFICKKGDRTVLILGHLNDGFVE